MRGLSSSVLSVTAMGLSSLTTYLTFFDASYTLTMANAAVELSVQSGGGSSGGETTAYFRFFLRPSIILSNRGNLAIVVSDVRLFRSTSLDTCTIADGDRGRRPFTGRNDTPATPRVVEPETLEHVTLEFGLEEASTTAKADADGNFDIPSDQGLWCLKWTLFDPNGKRHEPTSPVLTLTRSYEMKEGEKYPDVNVEKDFPKRPIRLVSRGLY